jgi:hypothetical protein
VRVGGGGGGGAATPAGVWRHGHGGTAGVQRAVYTHGTFRLAELDLHTDPAAVCVRCRFIRKVLDDVGGQVGVQDMAGTQLLPVWPLEH